MKSVVLFVGNALAPFYRSKKILLSLVLLAVASFLAYSFSPSGVIALLPLPGKQPVFVPSAAPSVLAASSKQNPLSDEIFFNLPATFNAKTIVNADSLLNGNATVSGNLTAPNIIYGLTAGQNITISGGQNPTISATFSGVVSTLQGQSGNLQLLAGSGVSVNNLTIANTDPGSAQKIFKNIAVGGTTLAAGSNTDTLTLSAGSGISLSPDSGSNTITISSSSNTSSSSLPSDLDTNGIIYAASTSTIASLVPGTAGYVLQSNGAGSPPSWVVNTSGASPSFAVLTSGTNTQAAMLVGSGASLDFTGSGTVNASSLNGNTFASPGAIGATTPGSGAFSSLSASGLLLANAGATVAAGTLTVSNLSAGVMHTNASGVVSSAPLNLSGGAAEISNTLPVGNGGTGLSSAPADGQLLIGNGTNYTLATLTGTVNQVDVTNNAGSITLSLPQNINTTSTATFASLTLSDNTNELTLGTGNTGTLSLETLTGSRTYTLPDSSGEICLTSGNCSGSGGALTGSGTTNFITKFTSASGVSDSSLFDNGSLGLGTNTPLASTGLDIEVNGKGNSILVLNQKGSGPILSASASGTPKFEIANNGTIDFSGYGTGILHSNASGSITSGAVNLATADVSGILGIGNGGTGLATIPTNGQLLIGNGTNYTQTSLTQGTNIAITNGSGSITVATSLTPVFTTVNGLSLTTNADGFSVSGGTTARTLNVTGSDITLTGGGHTLTLGNDVSVNQNLQTTSLPTFASLTLTANTNELTLGTGNTGTVSLGSLTAARTYTLPDATGTICLTTGNCAGAGNGITGSGTASQLAFFTGSQAISSDSTLFFDNTNKLFGIGNASPVSKLDLSGRVTGKALAVFNETGNQDIFTASASGTTRFTIANSGNINATGTITGLTGLTSSGTITLSSLNTAGVLHTNGSGVLATSAVNLAGGTSEITGTLPIGNGGTGLTTTPTNGQLLIGNGTGYAVANITGTGNQVNVANGSGSITLSLPQNIDTGASPTFTSANLTTLNLSANSNEIVMGTTNTGTLSLGSLTGSRTYTLPDATGTICLTTGNCSGAGGGVTTSGGSATQLAFFTGSQTIASDSNLFYDTTGKLLGIGTATPTARLDVEGAVTGKALSIFNQTGNQNILAASSSGTTEFAINNNGNFQFTGGTSFLNTITSAASSPQTYTLPDATGTICLTTGNCAGSGSGLTGAGTATQIAFFNSSQNLISDSNLYWNNVSKLLGIGSAAPVGKLDLSGKVTGKALAIFNETGDQALFTASASGITQFTVDHSGNVTLAGNETVQGATGTTFSGNGAGITFSGTNNHTLSASTGILQFGAATLTGAITGNNQNITGLTNLSAGGTITFSGLSSAGIVHNSAAGVLSTSLVNLTGATDVTGTLPIANGGTNQTSIGSAGRVVYSDGSTYNFSNVGTTGQALISGGTGAPTWFAPTQGSVLFAGASGVLSQDNGSFFYDSTNKLFGLGTSSPVARLDVQGAVTGKSLTIFNQTGDQNILTASASGTTEFSVNNNGNLQFSGGTSNLSTLTKTGTTAQTYTFPDASGTICLTTGNCAGAGSSITGSGTATQIAFFSGGTQNLSSDSNLYFDPTNKLLGIGTSTPVARLDTQGQVTGKALAIFNETGDQNIFTASASGTTRLTLDTSGDLNIIGGAYQIAGNSVLSATTLGTGVINSSLTSVGALASGSIASGFGTILTTNTIQGSNLTATGTTGLTASGNGAGLTFSGSGNHTLSASSGVLQLAATTLTGTITGNNQNITGLTDLAAAGTITFSGLSTAGIVHNSAAGVLSTSAVSLTADISGILPIANGGTNNASAYSAGSIIYSNGTSLTQDNASLFYDSTNKLLGIGTSSPVGKLTLTGAVTGKALAILNETGDQALFTASASGTTKFLIDHSGAITASDYSTGVAHFGSSGLISSSAVNLAGGSSEITGTLPIGNGGTGVTTTPTNGELLIGNGSGYTVANLTGTTNQVNVANGSGAITLSLPQNIDTGATPTFSSLTLSASSNQLTLGTTNTGIISATGLTTSRTYTLPDATGTICLTTGNCTGSGISGSGTNNYITKFTGSGSVGNSDIFDNGNVGIGTTSPVGLFDVEGKVTGKALSIFNETGDQALFTASASGTTEFTIAHDGTLTAAKYTTNNGLLYTNASGVITQAATGTDSQVLLSNNGTPTFTTLSGDATINDSGVLTLKNTGSASTYGSASQVPVFTTDAQGRVTGVTNTSIAIDASAITSGILAVNRGGTGADLTSSSQNAQGSIPYFNASGVMTTLAPGNSGYVLTTNGNGANPTWTNAASLGTNYWALNSGFLSPTNGGNAIAIGQTTGLANAALDAEVNGLGNAIAVFNQKGSGDIFTASSSGSTRFTIANNGNLSATGTLTGLTGLTSSGTITFSGLNSTGIVHTNGSGVLSTSAVSLTADVSGVLPIANGGTNNSSAYTNGSIIYSNGTNLTQDNSNLFYDATNKLLGIGTATPVSKLDVEGKVTGKALTIFNETGDQALFTASASGTTKFLIDHSGVITASDYGLGIAHFSSSGLVSSTQVNLASTNEVINTLGLANGGTGVTTTPSNGQLLIGNGSGYSVANLTGTTNQVNVSNGSGSITLSTPQNIDTGASPTFSTLNLSANTNQLVLGTTNTGTITVASLTGNHTYTLPDATGTICLTTGNCVGGGGGAIGGSGTNNYIAKFSPDGNNIADSLLFDNGSSVGLGTTSPIGLFDVQGGPAGKALSIFNYTGSDQNILTASSSGTTEFSVNNNGNLQFTGNTAFLNTLTSAATAARTYTLPDATGTICLTTGNCAGSGSGITGSGTATQIAFFSGGTQNLSSDSNLYFDPTNKLLGLGTSTPAGKLDVEGAVTGKSLTIFNQTGNQNILTASSSGTTEFSVNNNGNLQFSGNSSFLNTLTSAATAARTYTLPDATGTICLTTGNCSGTTGYWAINGSVIYPGASAPDGAQVVIGKGLTTSNFQLEVNGKQTGKALVSLNETGDQALLTASASGVTKFTVDHSGNLTNAGTINTANISGGTLSGGTYSATGLSVTGNYTATINNGGNFNISDGSNNLFTVTDGGTTGNLSNIGTLVAGGLISANGGLTVASGQTLTLSGTSNQLVFGNGNTGTLTWSPSSSRTITLPDATGTVCLQNSASCGFALGTNYWQLNSNVLSPGNSTYDLAIGGNATSSALFQVFGATGNATTAGTLTFTGTGSQIQSINNQTLTLGGNSTGDIQFKPGNSSSSLYLASSGNVGIGTTNPNNFTLQTAGNIGPNASYTYSLGSSSNLWNVTYSKWFTSGVNGGLALGLTSLNTGNGTQPIATLAANTSFAALVVDNKGVGDIFTASASGASRFTIANNGNLTASGTLTGLTGLTSSGTITFSGLNSTGIVHTNGSGVLSTSAVSLTADVSGILPIANGGTNNSSAYTAGSIIYSNGTSLTQDNSNLFYDGTNKLLGIGTATPVGKLTLTGAVTGKALAIFNQTGDQNILTASSSGTTEFSVNNNGNLQFTGNTAFLSTITSAATAARTYTLPDATGTICLTTGNCAGSGSGITGSGTATQIAFFSGASNNIASDSNLYFDNTNKLLGIGTSSPIARLDVEGKVTGKALAIFNETGDQNLFSASASGTTEFTINRTGDLGIAGSAVSSSNYITAPNFVLNTSGQITSGVWNGTVIASQYGGTGQNFSGSTGVPYISGGAWSVDSNSLAVNHGGTGTTTTFTQGSIVFAGASGVYSQNNNDFFWDNTNNRLGIGVNSSLLGTLDVRNLTGTLATASISGKTSFAALTVDNSGVGDIFAASSSGLNRFVITQNGNVGIGTTTPGFSLTVGGVAGQIAQFASGGGINDSSYIGFTGASRAMFGYDGATSNAVVQGIGSKGIEFNVNNATFGSGTAMIINSSGNVGIGTTTPTALLDVNGAASVSGSLTFRTGAGTIQTTANNTLTLGGGSTGNIILSPLNGAGNVGIDTTTPGAALDVNGTARATTLNATTALQTNSVTRIDNSGNLLAIGTITSSGYAGANAVLYAAPTTGLFTTSTTTTQNQCLLSGNGASGTPSWGTCALGTNYWQQVGNVLSPATIANTLSIGSTGSLATLDVRNLNGTQATASISGKTSFAGLVVDNSGVGDLFTASASGATRFTIGQNGNITASAYSTGIAHFSSTGLISSSAINLNSGDVTNTLGVSNGGTGASSFTTNGVLFGNNTGALGVTAQGAAGTVLHGNGGVPSFSAVSLTADVGSSILPLANGGTNANLTADNGGIVYSGASALAILAHNANSGLALVSGGAGAPSWFTPTQGSVVFAGANGALSQNNGSFFWDNSSNRLGLGTATPGSLLDLQASGGVLGTSTKDILRIENTDANAASNAATMSFFANRSGNIETPVASIAGLITNVGAGTYTGALSFATAGTAAVPVERMRIDGSGNLNLVTGAYQVNGTTVIDSSRNLNNIAGVATSLNPGAANSYNLGTGTGNQYNTIYGNQIFQNGNQVCDSSGSNCPGGSTAWTFATPNMYPTTSISRLGLGTTTTANMISELYVTRSLSDGALGKALAIFNQTENQDLFTASASGVTKFTVNNNGDLVLGTTTRLTNAGVGTFANNTVVGTDTFTANNIADSGALTVKSGGSGNLTLDTTGNQTISIGNTNANAIALGNSGQNTTLTLTGTGLTTLGGNLSINGTTLSVGNGSPATIQTPSANANLSIFTNGSGTLSLDSGTTGTINIGSTNNSAKTINIGTATAGNSINIGTNNTTADTIAIGSALDTVTIAGAGSTGITLGSNSGNGAVTIQPNAGGQAALILNKQGNNDIFAASASGTTKFVVNNSGNLQFTGNSSFLNTLTSAATAARTYTLPDATGTLCLTTGNCSGTTGYWAINSNVIYPGTSAPDGAQVVIGKGLTTTNFQLEVNGKQTGKALVSLNETGDQALFTASASGTSVFTLGRTGIITLNQASQINTGTNTLTLNSGGTGNLQFFSASNTLDQNGNLTLAGDVAVNGGDLTTTAATFNVANAATTLDLGSTNVTRTINIGTGTNADTINIGTGGTTADAITIGATGLNGTNGSMLNLPGGFLGSGAVTGKAFAILNETGNQNILTASASGTTAFVLDRTGDITLSSTTANADSLKLQPNASGSNSFTGTLTSTDLTAARTYTLPDATGTICLQSSASCGFALGTNYWQLNSTVLSPGNSTYDLAVGGNATSSALFQIFGATGNATTAGTLTFTGTGSQIQSIKNQTLTLGGNSTGDIQFKPGNSSSSLYLASNGNVGIGTTTPKLDLTVGGPFSGGFGLQKGDASPNAGYLRFGDNSGWKFIIGRTQESIGGAINTNTTGALVTVQDNGNVGIGTTNPGSPLSVTSANGLQAEFQSTGSFRGAIDINNVAGGQQSLLSFSDGGTEKWEVGKQSDNSFFMYDDSNSRNFLSVASGNVALAPAGGNVGIGVTNPKGLLQVGAQGAVTTPTFVYDASYSNSTGFADYIGDWWNTATWGIGPATGGVTDNLLRIGNTSATPANSWNATQNLNLVVGGNVGIGLGANNTLLATALDVRATLGTNSVASISGKTSFASLVVDNSGKGDLFTASSSGLPRFTISQNGNITDTTATAVNFSGAALTVASCSGCGGSSTWTTFTNNSNTVIDPNPITDALSIGNAGTGNYLPFSSFYVEPAFNSKGNALVGINQTGGGPIFTASQAGSTKFVIDNAGNVGIGTSTPGFKLVATGSDPSGLTEGQFGSTAPIYLESNYPTIGFNEYYNGTNNVYGTTGYGGRIMVNEGTGNMQFDVDGSGSGGSTVTHTIAMLINSNGNVGMGTSTMSNELNIGSSVSSGAPQFSIQNSAAGGSTWYLGSTDTGNSIGGGDFMINNSNQSTGSYLVINSSGNVGIGTTNPQAALSVAGSTILLGPGSGTAQQQQFTSDGSGNSLRISSAQTAGSAIFLQGGGAGKFQVGGANSGEAGDSMFLNDSGQLGIGTTAPAAQLDVEGGNVLIGQQPNTSAAADTTFTDQNEGCPDACVSGRLATTTNIASISASAVYNGSLYVGTTKTASAEVYQYSGSTGNWSSVSGTAGTMGGGATTGIASVSAMTVYNGNLFVGTSKVGSAEIYEYGGGTTWTKVTQATAGTISNAGTSAINGVTSMAVWDGRLYAGTSKKGTAELYRYEGGSTWTNITHSGGTLCNSTTFDTVTTMTVYNGLLWLATAKGNSNATMCQYEDTGSYLQEQTTPGQIVDQFGGTTFSAIQSITSMVAYDGHLYLSTRATGGKGAIFEYEDTGTNGTTQDFSVISSNTAGTIDNGSTTGIDGAILTVYNGKLFAGTEKAGGAEVYRYEDGFGSRSNWTKVSNATAGRIASGGTSNINMISNMIPYNGSLYLGTYNVNNAEMYSYNVVTNQSYALEFNATTSQGGGEQNNLPNLGTITFQASPSANVSSPNNNTGQFIFSNSIVTNTGAYDYAEDYGTRDDNLSPGDIVALDPNENDMVKTASSPQDSMIGIYSTDPGFDLSQADSTINGGRAIPVALTGRVPVKVSTESGSINIGDMLTISSTPGVAMKATQSGFVVARAMESFDGDGVGTVMAFVNPTWYVPSLSISANGNVSVNGVTPDDPALDLPIPDSSDPVASGSASVAPAPPLSLAQLTNNLNSLSSSVSAIQSQTASLSGQFASLNAKFADLQTMMPQLASGSGFLLDTRPTLDTLSPDATLSGSLSVLGQTLLSDVGITGRVTDGILSINGLDEDGNASINTVGGDLKLQDEGVGGIDILAGQIKIDTDGNITSKATITAKVVNTTKLNIVNDTSATTSAVLSTSAGSVVIKAGETSIDINTTALTHKSLIFATPDQPVSIGAKATDTDTFTITLQDPQDEDIHVNWWIVN